MLSPGKDYLHVPTDTTENVRWRVALLTDCLSDPVLQVGMIEICKQDILFYIRSMVWQYNPMKLGDEIGPFVPWDFQERCLTDGPESDLGPGFLWCYENGKDCVCEKSREMGISWLLLIMQDWLCRFHDRQKWLDISLSAEAVDETGDPDCLFWKLDFINEHLPSWMTGPRRRGSGRGINRKDMFIEYDNKSITTGKASTGIAGVSGRCHGAVIDEFSLIVQDEEVRRRTASTARSRFFNGTHQGTHTEFYRLTTMPEFTKRVMHWTQHPDKNKGLYSYDTENHKTRFWEYVSGEGLKELRGPNFDYGPKFNFVMDGSPTGGPFPGIRSPWYDAKAIKIGTVRGVAMELDINPTLSASTPFDPMMIHRLKNMCRPPDWEGDLEFNTRGELVRLIPQPGGPLKLWCKLNDGKPAVDPYGAGADVSNGHGASPSCLSFANARTGQKVAQYVNSHIPPDRFGILAAALCRWFVDVNGTGARICWEHVGPGVGFYKEMVLVGYRNFGNAIPEDKVGRFRMVSAPGWNPTKKSKVLMLNDYGLALANGEFLNLDEDSLEDCLAFRYGPDGSVIHALDDSDRPEAARDNHGDVVIADGLDWKMVKDIGVLASRLKQNDPDDRPELSIFTFEGRRSLRERLAQLEVWD